MAPNQMVRNTNKKRDKLGSSPCNQRAAKMSVPTPVHVRPNVCFDLACITSFAKET